MAEQWYDLDETWENLAGVLFTQRAWARAENEIGLLVGLLGLTGDETILDIPCGTGRHALELARRGFGVTGVDRTQSYLDEARRRAADESLQVHWVQDDMRSFSRPEAFEIVLNMYTSFGYFQDIADDRKAARGFFDALRPGGRLVMELHGKENLAAGFAARDWVELDDGRVLLEERTIEDDWRAVRNRWIVYHDGGRYELEFSLRLYGASELVDLLRGVGFSEITVFGNLEGDPYDEHARRLVVVAAK